jgi:hypothetical protein
VLTRVFDDVNSKAHRINNDSFVINTAQPLQAGCVPRHHGMGRPRVTDTGTASSCGG